MLHSEQDWHLFHHVLPFFNITVAYLTFLMYCAVAFTNTPILFAYAILRNGCVAYAVSGNEKVRHAGCLFLLHAVSYALDTGKHHEFVWPVFARVPCKYRAKQTSDTADFTRV